jgi:hypothetical protein
MTQFKFEDEEEIMVSKTKTLKTTSVVVKM